VQILANRNAQSSGQLNWLSTAVYLVGNLIRIGTSYTELKGEDVGTVLSNVAAGSMNAALLAQIYLYRNNSAAAGVATAHASKSR
jgi:hypothetical protein